MIKNQDAIKDAVQIADIIGEFISLKKKGVNYIACCPFHNEKTSSFIVSPVRNTYKCFGCGKHGDAIEFLKEHEQMTFVEALQFLGKKYKITLEIDRSEKDIEADTKRESIFAVLKWASSQFSQNYLKNNQAREYIKSRVLLDAVEPFGIGYSEAGNDLMRAAQAAGYSNQLLFDAGLIKVNDTGNYYDAFSRRIMFPFYDRSGRIIGFTGRILTAEKDKAKYLNSNETEVFKKSKFLYGLYQAKKDIMKANECLLVEGQTDLISLHLAGIKNVVAGSGTALSEDQVKMVGSLTHTLTLVYDYDPAGIKASVANIKIPLQLGLDVYVVVLPKGEDPDSYVRKIGGEEMAAYIEKNRKDIVSFRIGLVKEEVKKDPLKKGRLVIDLTQQISLIQDEQMRSILIQEIAKQLELDNEELHRQVKKQLPPVTEIPERGFYGLSLSDEKDKSDALPDPTEESIKKNDKVVILPNPSEVVTRHANGFENVISLPLGPLKKDDIYRLAKLTKNVLLDGLTIVVNEFDAEFPLAMAGRLLTENGLRVEVRIPRSKPAEEDPLIPKTKDFLDYYVGQLSDNLRHHPDTKRSKKYIELVAEFLSKLDNTIINIKTNDIAKEFGLTQAAFTKVLKPYVDKRKNLAVQQQERVVIDDQHYVFDISNLPDYVDQVFFHRYGFFPAQNKTGHNIFYVFRSMDSNTLIKIGNFYMEPLFQVYNDDQNRNKRFVRFFHAELNTEEYAEIRSGDMIELGPFKKFLWNFGGYVFTNGKQYHHEKIMESIALRFPKCWEIDVFGWQSEGFFAFSNGIYADGSFTSVDDLGLVKFKNETYYLPAFSKIYKDVRSDNDKYENDRYLIYKPDHRTSWSEWVGLMLKVYSYNNNGMWAILFTMMSAYRSLIFQIDRIFTAPFFIGPTDSGKSKVAESIRAPFMFGASLFNLNSGTDAAFFTTLERNRDVPVIYEEYNDYSISDVKFQGLKQSVYDGEGKQKRKDASSKDIDVSKINSAMILLGQEAPERDDGALGNRVVLLPVPKKEYWSDEETNNYNDLKKREHDGLSNIAANIIDQRPVVKQFFASYMRQYQKKLKEDIQAEGGTYQTRIVNTVSLFVSMAKLCEDHIKNMPLSFTFEDFYKVAKAQINRQSEELTTSNRLSVFFDTIAMLYAQDQIISGREFAIASEVRLTVMKTRTETDEINWNGESKRVLYLIINDVIQIYQKLHSKESLKMNALRTYLRDHPTYLGHIKSHRFIYEYEALDTDSISQVTRRVMRKAERNTSCIALDYDKLFALGIDLEKMKSTLEQSPTLFPVSVGQDVKEDLPF